MKSWKSSILIRSFLHKLRLYRWLLQKPTNSYDYCGEAFLSAAARWHGEWDPILTYMSIISTLRNEGFHGKILELGGGYSTILLDHYLSSQKTRIHSLDANPDKYIRILNSSEARDSFLSSINSIRSLSVTKDQAIEGITSTLDTLYQYSHHDIRSALSAYITEPKSLDQIFTLFKEQNLLQFIINHPHSISEIPFYDSFLNTTSYVTSILDSGSIHQLIFDAIFFDCGEMSSIAEWHFLSCYIPVNGFAILHDIFYPKSIKNFLVATSIRLSPSWNVIWEDRSTPQGALIARRIH